MVSRWADIQTIDGVRTVVNIVKASEEVAKERGYVPADGLQIGMAEIDGTFCQAERKAAPKSPFDELVETLVRKGVLTEKDKPRGRHG